MPWDYQCRVWEGIIVVFLLSTENGYTLTVIHVLEGSSVRDCCPPQHVKQAVRVDFFRLENEHLNNCGKFRAVRDISVAPIDSSYQAQILRMMDDEDGVVNRHKKKTGKKKEDTKLLMPECSEPSSFLEVP